MRSRIISHSILLGFHLDRADLPTYGLMVFWPQTILTEKVNYFHRFICCSILLFSLNAQFFSLLKIENDKG